jgi:chemotaxis protein methyltransferase CheR
VTRAADPTGMARFRDLIRARTGMTLPESRTPDVTRAVRRAAADSDVPDADALYELLLGGAGGSAPLDALVAALNVGETHLFRDAVQVQALERRILPEVIVRRRRERRLRLWSAGCSTGEEAYTLAILVERLLPDLADWDVLIRATDINGRSLERARRGVYGAWSFRGVPPLVRTSCFTRRGDGFEVAPSLRAMVTFAQLNLSENVYPSPTTDTGAMDLILCRNVLMYFDEAGGRAVVGRLRDALDDRGWLLVSQVEAGLDLFDGLAQDAAGTAVYRRVRPAPPAPEARQEGHAAPGAAAGPPEAPARRSPPPSRRRPPPARDAEDPAARTAHEDVLRLWSAGLPEAAIRRLEAMTESRPLAAPLHYLHGLILLDGDRTADALAAFRRCTYADPEFALGHLAQAGLLAGMRRRGRALAALETTARLVAGLEPDALLLQGDGLAVGDVLELIAAQRELLALPGAAKASRG